MQKEALQDFLEPALAEEGALREDEIQSANQDRRHFRRYEIALPATIKVHGTIHTCAIHDISVGGARLRPGDDAWEGECVTLYFEELNYEEGISGTVVSAGKGDLRISFSHSPDADEALTIFLVGIASLD